MQTHELPECCQKLKKAPDKVGLFYLAASITIAAIAYTLCGIYGETRDIITITASVSATVLVILFVTGFFYYDIVGKRVFLFLDTGYNLHIHDMKWWVESPVYQRRDVLIELWIGGWFRRCKVFGHHAECWHVSVGYTWVGKPRWLIISDHLGCTLKTPLTYTTNEKWAIGNLTALLQTMYTSAQLEDVIRRSNSLSNERAIAGKVGTA